MSPPPDSLAQSPPSSAPVSVVTVAYNNVQGLVRTLDSLLALRTRPAEIVVIDGGSCDSTVASLERYQRLVPGLRYLSEPDDGIYAAMNKGKRLVQQPLIHYLNGGDIILGEPYEGLERTMRLPVEIFSPDEKRGWQDFIKLGGFGYCHQGLIFPVSHPDYDLSYRIAGDFDVIMRTFPNGLHSLPVASSGRVRYYLGGISSQRSLLLDKEVLSIAARNRGATAAAYMLAVVIGRRLMPRQLRRTGARIVHALR